MIDRLGEHIVVLGADATDTTGRIYKFFSHHLYNMLILHAPLDEDLLI